MDDHNFIMWEQDDEPNYDEMIENDNDMEELNDMIEEQVEGYEEVNILEENSENDEAYYIDEDIIPASQENLIYFTDDNIVNGSSQIGVGMSHLIEQRVQEAENKIIGDQDVQEVYSATVEEVIMGDWPLEGEEVQVAMEQVVTTDNFQEEETIPLHTDQDEYTTSRPHPCDFCSRRFRKKANLMNHMVAHQNVRPHMCNLCGSRYVRKCDLINHLKIHAYNIEDESSIAASTGGKKKPPKFDELDYFNDTYDDIPDDDDFDYNHYSKPTTSTAPVRASKQPAKKKPAKKTTAKFEKLTKEKPVSSDINITFGDNNDDDIAQQMSQYVERYPITDPRKPFVCQHCGVAFTREKALESHTKLHANQEPTYDCEVCGDSFFDNSSLEEHLELRHDFSSRVRRTGGKSTSGKTSRTAKVLETIDYDDSNSEYEPDKNNEDVDDDDEEEEIANSCDKCHLTFKNPDALKRHIKTHFIKSEVLSDDEGRSRPQATDGTPLGCNVCGENFTEALDLLAHAEIHARFQPFKCQLCGDTFFEENKIKIHLMDNHQNELTESSCRLCGKQCRDQRSLIKHSWEHSREKNHPCSKCGKTFHNKARLKRHISSHRNKSVMCEICHEEFPDGRQLMNHRHSHTKANQFPCHECGKTFGSRSSQQIHIRIHTGERPYGCRFCWKAFADGGTLRKHERIHTGEKPYCCLVCPRAFNQRVVLREHIRSHHSAPDPVHGTTLTPFYCSLCGDLFAVSLELIHHLIEHSDQSTAAKRVQPTGPRKYKRRRKINGDSDNSDFVAPVETNRVQKAVKQEPMEIDLKKNVLCSAFPIPSNSADFKLPDEIFLSLGKQVPIVKREEEMRPTPRAAATSARPKMIYTQKTRVAVADGKRKTKTMIQKQVVQAKAKPQSSRVSRNYQPQLKVKEQFEHDESSETWSNDDPNEDVLDTLLKRERKLSEKFTIDLVNDLQDILRSPLKTNDDRIYSNGEDEDLFDHHTRRSRRPTTSRYGSPSKKPSTSKGHGKGKGKGKGKGPMFEGEPSSIFIKEEAFEEGHPCGICGDAFETREELLIHVPIHI